MDPLVPIDQLEMFAHGLDHAEGIAVTADGTVYVGGEAGQLYRIGADDTVEEVLTTSTPAMPSRGASGASTRLPGPWTSSARGPRSGRC
jgi:hypothetical protein